MSVTQQTRSDEHQLFFDVIRQRRSVRSYDPEFKISQQELSEILGFATLAPSWSNLQPWRFLVIDKPELKQKIPSIANNQQQVIEASAVIAVLADLKCYERLEEIYGQAVKAGYMPADTAKSFVERFSDIMPNLPSDVLHQIVNVDSGLAAMQLMLVARAKGYDTVPMGGYDKAKFMESFNIPDRYLSVMLIAIGKAVKPGHPTTRLPIDNVTYFNEMPQS